MLNIQKQLIEFQKKSSLLPKSNNENLKIVTEEGSDVSKRRKTERGQRLIRLTKQIKFSMQYSKFDKNNQDLRSKTRLNEQIIS